MVYAIQRRKNLGALGLRLQRPALSFQCSHTGVGIDAENQHISKPFGILQVPDVAYMKEIKTAVGKNNFPPGSAQLCNDAFEFIEGFYFQFGVSPHILIRDSKFEIRDYGSLRMAA